ncbi:hypothetical protein BDY19DRAFT_289806 [Irpex rosettiformis]|uniref:Uncharacterized protein n=1 Tax=Irpex rosettiformis TaxID=378272 RepID=A0ACB8UHY9_9APHY|nr:hypothetical protein BDY19DRAFT_289806 [Irpex rosettiformis]
METPQRMFFVPALISFNSGRKTQVEARKRFDDVNKKNSKLPGLLGALKLSKPTDSPSPVSHVQGKKTQVIGPISTNATACQAAAPRQSATPSPEIKLYKAVQVTKARAVTLPSVRRPSAPRSAAVSLPAGRVKTSVKSSIKESISPASSSKIKVVKQLPTPPPTPPLESQAPNESVRTSRTEKKARIPRYNAMVFPKPTPISYSKPTNLMSESEASEISLRPVQKNVRKAPASPLVPKPVPKIIQNGQAAKRTCPYGKIPRTSTNETQVKSITSKRKSRTTVVVEKEASPKKTQLTATGVVKPSKASDTEIIPPVAKEAAEEQVENIKIELPIVAIHWETSRTLEPSVISVVERTTEVQEGLCSEEKKRSKASITSSNANSQPSKPISPRKATHSPAMTELQAVLERRKVAISSWHPYQPKESLEEKATSLTAQTVTSTGR